MIKRKPMKYEPTPIPAGEKYTKLEILDKLEGYDLVDDINSIDSFNLFILCILCKIRYININSI